MALSRRAVVGLAGATALLGGGALLSHLLSPRRARPAGLHRDPAGLLELAEGFTCVELDRTGRAMSDGYLVPGRPDGMGCFPREDGMFVLMRNHELLPGYANGPAPDGQPLPKEAFDPSSPGGVTRLVVDPAALRGGAGPAVRSSNLVLVGTNFNCSGGPSPWGWLSCEEDVEPGHGFVFLCETDAERVAPARPIPAFGRFRHEAAAVDAATGIVYLTEDRPEGCLYRFVPTDRARPFEGRLEALALRGAPSDDASATARLGAIREIEWVPVEEPAPPQDVVRSRARGRGAASFHRLEGATLAEGALIFNATNGGAAGLGQVFRLRPKGEGGTLELLFESTDPDTLSLPDNVAVSPWGDIYLAEDGEKPNGIRCLTRKGELRPLAVGALSGGELAGVCFSPDGAILFANLQSDGITLAIVGPFEAFGA